ncbi:hypothetical protein ACFQV2_21935 [Actinokineospora soli]|uniref:Substrate-binding protein-like domain-containing protein n=1 Tax=Actinokineospora soli TaxID=1048753 RepID=A0ABW2TQH2_9PSEU
MTVDGAGGLRQAVAHLAALGHRRIAHLVSARGSRAVRQAANAASVDLVEFPGERASRAGWRRRTWSSRRACPR